MCLADKVDQPRYYCQACQRHWTDGGSLRVVAAGASKRAPRGQRNGSTNAGIEGASDTKPLTAQSTKTVRHSAVPAARLGRAQVAAVQQPVTTGARERACAGVQVQLEHVKNCDALPAAGAQECAPRTSCTGSGRVQVTADHTTRRQAGKNAKPIDFSGLVRTSWGLTVVCLRLEALLRQATLARTRLILCDVSVSALLGMQLKARIC